MILSTIYGIFGNILINFSVPMINQWILTQIMLKSIFTTLTTLITLLTILSLYPQGHQSLRLLPSNRILQNLFPMRLVIFWLCWLSEIQVSDNLIWVITKLLQKLLVVIISCVLSLMPPFLFWLIIWIYKRLLRKQFSRIV
jgi:hypothetical protein